MSGVNFPRIIKGKEGTALEGAFLLAIHDSQAAASAAIQASGATRAGARNNVQLWRLPDGTCEKGAEAVLSSLQTALEGANDVAGPGEEVSVATEAAANGEDQPAATGGDLGGKAQSPSSRNELIAEDRLDHGYRMGMSVAERDLYRRPVVPGSVAVGSMIEVDGRQHEVIGLSGKLHASGDTGRLLMKRFPDCGIEPDGEYQFAMWAVEPDVAPQP